MEIVMLILSRKTNEVFRVGSDTRIEISDICPTHVKLVLDEIEVEMRPSQSLKIGGTILRLLDIWGGKTAKFGFSAPPEIKIYREEILNRGYTND